MGLDITARNSKTSFDFRMPYGRYSAFRDIVFEVVKGPLAAQAHRQNQFAAMTELAFGNDPQMMSLFHMSGGARVPVPETEPCPDLDLFMNHSDCDGEFSRAECGRLYAFFRKHKSAFTKRVRKSDVKEEMMGLYADFIKATKIASGKDGKMIYH